MKMVCPTCKADKMDHGLCLQCRQYCGCSFSPTGMKDYCAKHLPFALNMPRKRFRLHFNRINMQRGNPNVWTVHTSKACYQVREVKVYVPVETRYNPKGQQPRAYFVGSAHIEIRDGVAVLS